VTILQSRYPSIINRSISQSINQAIDQTINPSIQKDEHNHLNKIQTQAWLELAILRHTLERLRENIVLPVSGEPFPGCIITLFVTADKLPCIFPKGLAVIGWLVSRVVSVLVSGAEGPGSNRSHDLRQTAHTHCAFVHQAAKLVTALLRVARVTAGLAESNGSLPPGS